MELSALGRRDRGCSWSVFLGSRVLAFVLLAEMMTVHRCAYTGDAARSGPDLRNLHCLSWGKVVSPSAWQGQRRSQVTQDVNSNVLWWTEEPEGGGAEPLWAGAFVSRGTKAARISLSRARVPVLLGLIRISQTKPLDKGQTSCLPVLLEQFPPRHGSDSCPRLQIPGAGPAPAAECQ